MMDHPQMMMVKLEMGAYLGKYIKHVIMFDPNKPHINTCFSLRLVSSHKKNALFEFSKIFNVPWTAQNLGKISEFFFWEFFLRILASEIIFYSKQDIYSQ